MDPNSNNNNNIVNTNTIDSTSSSSSSSPGLIHRMVDAFKAHIPGNAGTGTATQSESSTTTTTDSSSLNSSSTPPSSSYPSAWSDATSADSSDIPIASYPPPPDPAPSADPTMEYSLPTHPYQFSSSIHPTADKVKEKAAELKDQSEDRMEALRMEAGEIRRDANDKSTGLMATLRDKISHFHPFSSTPSSSSSSPSPAATSTTATIVSPASGTGSVFTREGGRSENSLSEKEKEEMDRFPTKFDRQGDLETFKKHVHSSYERGLGIDKVRDERHYTRTLPVTSSTSTTTTTSSSPSDALEHVSTVPLVSSTPFADDVSAADPALDLPTKTSTGEKISEKMAEMKEKTAARMEQIKEKAEDKMEKVKEKAGELVENIKEDYQQMKANIKESGGGGAESPALEHFSTVPIVSSSPFPDDVPAADPNLDLPTTTTPTTGEKIDEIKDKAGEKMEEMREKTGQKMEEAKGKTGGMMEHMKEDYRHVKDSIKADFQIMKDKFHDAGDQLRHSVSPTSTTTTTEITTTEPAKATTTTETIGSDKDLSSGGISFSKTTKESRELNPNEKEGMEQFPTKVDERGDLETFKKAET